MSSYLNYGARDSSLYCSPSQTSLETDNEKTLVKSDSSESILIGTRKKNQLESTYLLSNYCERNTTGHNINQQFCPITTQPLCDQTQITCNTEAEKKAKENESMGEVMCCIISFMLAIAVW